MVRGSKRNPAGGMDVYVLCCTVRTKGRMQDNPKTQERMKYKKIQKNPDGGKIFSYKMGRGSLSLGKVAGAWRYHSPPSTAEVK
jgi:hypothetical protein